MELGSARSLLSFDMKLEAANRTLLHSSGDPSQDSFVMAVWQLTNHQPHETQEFQEQMAVCVHMSMYVSIHIYTFRVCVYFIGIYTHGDIHTLCIISLHGVVKCYACAHTLLPKLSKYPGLF